MIITALFFCAYLLCSKKALKEIEKLFSKEEVKSLEKMLRTIRISMTEEKKNDKNNY